MSAEQLEAALQTLANATSRTALESALKQLDDAAVRAHLKDQHRPLLRQVYDKYSRQPVKDKDGRLRQSITLLLTELAHPDDADLFIRSATTYQYQPDDVAQNLRAAGLVGLASIDETLAGYYATRLLGEARTSFNGEPSLTALNVLQRCGQILPVYHFISHIGLAFSEKHEEVVAHAFEILPADFPVALFIEAAEMYVASDRRVVCAGLIDAAVKREEPALHDLLEQMAGHSHNRELARYTLIMMAASRQAGLIERLYRLARLAPLERVADYIEAIELTQRPERDDLLVMLSKRLARP